MIFNILKIPWFIKITNILSMSNDKHEDMQKVLTQWSGHLDQPLMMSSPGMQPLSKLVFYTYSFDC